MTNTYISQLGDYLNSHLLHRFVPIIPNICLFRTFQFDMVARHVASDKDLTIVWRKWHAFNNKSQNVSISPEDQDAAAAEKEPQCILKILIISTAATPLLHDNLQLFSWDLLNLCIQLGTRTNLLWRDNSRLHIYKLRDTTNDDDGFSRQQSHQ